MFVKFFINIVKKNSGLQFLSQISSLNCFLTLDHDQIDEFINRGRVRGSSQNPDRESHSEADNTGDVEHTEELTGPAAGETRGIFCL